MTPSLVLPLAGGEMCFPPLEGEGQGGVIWGNSNASKQSESFFFRHQKQQLPKRECCACEWRPKREHIVERE